MSHSIIYTLILLLFYYLWKKVTYHRTKQYSKFPQLPPTRTWGHLAFINSFMKTNVLNIHFDYYLKRIYDSLDKPPVFLLDLRPLSYVICVICNHEVSEQISKASKVFPYSLPKTPTAGFIGNIVGPKAIILAENEQWKALRKRLSPGFSRQYLTGVMGCILDKAQIFMANLDYYASSGEPFLLDTMCSNLTFDIIGAVAMDIDMNSQLGEKNESQIVRAFRQLRSTYNFRNGIWAFLPSYQKWRLTRYLDTLIKEVIRETFKEQRKNPQKQSRSVLSLSLAGKTELTPEILDETCDQLKTFLFAGHDTTSALLQWTFYEFSRNPRVLDSVRREIDTVLGVQSSPSIVRDRILESRAIFLKSLPYTSGIMKEILRLYPPAATGRYATPHAGFSLQLPNQQDLCVDGLVLYNCHSIIQRDKDVYGDTADEFNPERWLGGSEANFAIPPSAWRPFERGPRNCIGQELVTIEVLVILACVVRRYDWEKIGLGAIKRDDAGEPIQKANGQYEVQSTIYNTMEISSKPLDGMKMRVKLAPK